MGLKIETKNLTPALAAEIAAICPFGAIEADGAKLSINAACKNCKLCVKKSNGVITWEDEEKPAVDKSKFVGVAVFGEVRYGKLLPVTLELLGKARELADQIAHPVYAVLIGENLKGAAEDALRHGADKAYCYDHEQLKYRTVVPFTACIKDFIDTVKPSSVLFGATNFGRSLAPRVAARCGAGLTADCTMLEMKENTDLVQIRPAFGGNIMARIVSPQARPQFCTVRYKTFDALPRSEELTGEVVNVTVTDAMLQSGTEVLSVAEKPKEVDISDADVIVACGRGFKSKEDLALAQELADLIGAQVACSRPLAESGWMDAKHQIGLSGRTVKPKLIITLGISGTVQFTAGMKASDFIVAINADPDATIFEVAHVGVVGDLYEVVPKLIEKIKEGRENV